MDNGPVYRDQQFNGFRQKWYERTDGVFHGEYVVYWESGPVVCMAGQYFKGDQDGVWTHWDRHGKLDAQHRYERDRLLESRREPPWFTPVEDQVFEESEGA